LDHSIEICLFKFKFLKLITYTTHRRPIKLIPDELREKRSRETRPLLGPVQAAAAAACHRNRRRAPENPPLQKTPGLVQSLVVVYLTPSSRPDETSPPPRGRLGGRQASWSDSPPKNVLSSSSVQYVHKSDIP